VGISAGYGPFGFRNRFPPASSSPRLHKRFGDEASASDYILGLPRLVPTSPSCPLPTLRLDRSELPLRGNEFRVSRRPIWIGIGAASRFGLHNRRLFGGLTASTSSGYRFLCGWVPTSAEFLPNRLNPCGASRSLASRLPYYRHESIGSHRFDPAPDPRVSHRRGPCIWPASRRQHEGHPRDGSQHYRGWDPTSKRCRFPGSS